MSVNKVILVGRLGADPELRSTQGGASVATFNLATSESWMDKQSGQKQEKTEWHRVVVWGKLADLSKQYLNKGKQVYIEGKLQTRQWQDAQGQTKYTTEVVCQSMQFLGGSAGAGASNSASSFNGNQSSSSMNGPGPSSYEFGGGSSAFTEDDIPF